MSNCTIVESVACKYAMPTTTAEDVLLFVPNLIGYGRIICTLASLFLMIAFPRFWVFAVALYILSFVGDLFGKILKKHGVFGTRICNSNLLPFDCISGPLVLDRLCLKMGSWQGS